MPHSAATGRAVLEYLASGVAVIRLGDPQERVVTITAQRIESLHELLQKVRAERPSGLIIAGPGPEMFTAGADINLIRDVTDPALGEKLAREGQMVFDEIANMPFPTIAAISGPCVGGGCEMVLACRYRLISDHKSSQIGLPEIRLGILPGFGGTQRLPRLVGLPKALDIILAGKTLRPKQALACGLVDEIVTVEKLMDRANLIVIGSAAVHRHRISFRDRLLTNTRLGRGMVEKNAAKGIDKETHGFYPAPPAALKCCIYGLENGIEAGLKLEARELGRLIATAESKSLIRLFFLSEASKAIGKAGRKAADAIQAIVVGAGVMGAGIAGILARNDCGVILRDTTDEALSKAGDQIRKYLDQIKHLSDQERSFILNRIELASSPSTNTGNCNFAIEAIFEDLQIKQKILTELAALMPQDAIITTNTSSLSVTEIASAIPAPERVAGMHFFNPVPKMPLVEVISGAKTNDKTLAIVAALATKLGKFPIVVKDVPGFLVNRILAPYLNEAAFLLEQYEISDVDKAATQFGMPMGPLRLLDEVGLDVAMHVQEIMLKGYGERMRGPGHAARLVQLGRKGKKSGAGFYNFEGKDSVPWAELRSALGLQPALTGADLQTISDRLIFALINEAVRCLDDGVAGVPGKEASEQIDLGTVMGMGFPPFRGGLLYYAQRLGPTAVLAKLRELEKLHGARFTPAPGIERRAGSGMGFI
ncbi:MAG: enoyl-CoA hydratase/isomerase family protein [Oligoflexia bacterium]|nr:enoyl-CoA hydratase/isomerase family protein [Oligoflexia bacterium]